MIKERLSEWVNLSIRVDCNEVGILAMTLLFAFDELQDDENESVDVSTAGCSDAPDDLWSQR